MESDSFDDLVAYLADAPGGTCTIPFLRIRELTRAALPDAAMSAAWWTDEAGWRACPASEACLSAGWRLESVHAAAQLIRLVRTGDESAVQRGRGASAAPRRRSDPRTRKRGGRWRRLTGRDP